MFTLWPEPVELPEDWTGTPMYKTEVFDSPEAAKRAFDEACKTNKFPFVYLKPVSQPLETDNTSLTNDELLKKKKEVSIPSFTVGDDSIKNPYATNETTYTMTGYTLDEAAQKSRDVEDGSFDNILKAVSELKDYIKDKDALSKVQTGIILAAQSFRKKSTENKYSIYSITEEQDKKAEEWWSKHYKKYHSKVKKPLCAGMESENVYEWHFTNIGPYCVSVCKRCESLYKEQKEKVRDVFKQLKETEDKKEKQRLSKEYAKASKLADKLYKQATYTIQEIDE